MSKALQYRPDIDGLRAVAVGVVVACHAGVPGFSGGFVGVDVFFVISGYLITGMLVKEQREAGRIDLADFYARRVRRLIPALALVLAATTLAAPFVLLPNGELQTFAQSALSVIFFISNFFFRSAQLGYFGEQADVLPLLHTWSLAVEEQFYLLWPLALIAVAALAARWRLNRAWLLVGLVALGVASSLLLFVVVGQFRQNVAFFLTPFRAWELGVGALLALNGARLSPRMAPWFGVVGLAAIAAAATLFAYDTLFIGAAAVLAVFGAAAVIAGGTASPGAPASRLLASAPFVAVGRLSYSWYLWHWPLLALARAQDLGQRSLPRDAALALLALGLAALTWRFIEQPVRARRPSPFDQTRSTLIAGAAMLGVCALLAAGVWLWADSRAPRDAIAGAVARARAERVVLSDPCNGSEPLVSSPADPAGCLMGDRAAGKAVALWGDSHARHFTPAVDGAARTAGAAVIPAIKSGCRPFLSFYEGGRKVWADRERRCKQFNRAVLAALPAWRADHGLAGVILAARWDADDGDIAQLAGMIEQMNAQGLRVLLVAQTPVYPYDVPGCVARIGPVRCGVSRQAVDAARTRQLAALRRLALGRPDVAVWDPVEAMCSPTRCEPVAGGRILYNDKHHLNRTGSAALAGPLAPALAWLVGSASAPPRQVEEGR